MKSILIAVVALAILAAVELFCLRSYTKMWVTTFARSLVTTVAAWIETAPPPPLITWGLFGISVVRFSRANHNPKAHRRRLTS